MRAMTVKRVFGVLFGVLILAGIAVGGYWVLERTKPNICPICARGIHAKAAVVLELDGRQQRVCCASCAVRLGRQTGRPVKLVEVTDYLTERPLRPQDAYYVEGSQIIFCELHEPPRGPDKQPSDRVFDRCEPSVFAFARREDAQAFTHANGGALLRLDQLLGEERRQP
jgi:hypothetical protein